MLLTTKSSNEAQISDGGTEQRSNYGQVLSRKLFSSLEQIFDSALNV